MSRRSKKLQEAFEVQVSEPKVDLRGMGARARARAVEAATRKLERGIPEETQRRLKAEEERQERIRRDKAAAEEKKRAAKEKAREERLEAQQACTCRKPTLDRNGKCKRCHLAPASPRKGWGKW